MIAMLLTLVLLHSSSLFVVATPSSRDSRDCAASWTLLSTQQNQLTGGRDIQVRLGYTSGPRQTPSSLTVEAYSKPTTILTELSVRLQTGSTEMTIHSTGDELDRLKQSELTVTVPPRGTVAVWQLTVIVSTSANDGSVEEVQRHYNLDHTSVIVTSGRVNPPNTIISCSANYRTRQLISEDTPVRLRHANTGRYLVMRLQRGWEAATLSYSREYRYRLIGIGTGGVGSGVRIEAETHTFGGYRYAYASLRGGVYFDTFSQSSLSQQWQLSNPYPRQGDRVTFRNRRWPRAALQASADFVRCFSTQNPDWWILETDG